MYNEFVQLYSKKEEDEQMDKETREPLAATKLAEFRNLARELVADKVFP